MGDLIDGPWPSREIPETFFGPHEQGNVSPIPRREFGLRRSQRIMDLRGGLIAVRDELVRQNDLDEQNRVKKAARAARAEYDAPKPSAHVCRSLLDALATELGVASELCATRAQMLRQWNHIPECVALHEIGAKLETLAAQILAIHHTEQTP